MARRNKQANPAISALAEKHGGDDVSRIVAAG
jgi:hypothetical protein